MTIDELKELIKDTPGHFEVFLGDTTIFTHLLVSVTVYEELETVDLTCNK